jgi:hypothetical protein
VHADSATRKLTIVAQDPGVRYAGDVLRARVEVPQERLVPGPSGYRVQVVDYDATTNTLYRPRADRLDEDPWARADGDRLLADPQFHAQNCYALVMSTLGRFEHALGRRVGWAFPGRGHQIKVAPHAFAEANAYYSRSDEALLFGYFRGRRKQLVFTCLSHDVIVHETSHALLDGLRPRYVLSSSPDQTAFHEGFADIVAILSTFSLPEVMEVAIAPLGRNTIARSRLEPTKLRKDALFLLGEQVGREIAQSRGEPALRASLRLAPSKKYLAQEEFRVPHRRGEILVAALLEAFVQVWSARLLPQAERLRELDTRHVIDEGATVAAYLLTMVIRALDYAPPVDLQFSDFLSAILTSDHELHADDRRYGFRERLRASFAAFGIEPATRTGPERGLWRRPPTSLRYDRNRHAAMRRDADEVFRFLWENREPLRLAEDAYTFVQSVRPCVRTGSDGFVLEETVAEYVQILDVRAGELVDYGLRKPDATGDNTNLRLYGGGVLIFDDFGRLKFHVSNDVLSERQSSRLAYAREQHALRSDEALRDIPFAHLHDDRGRAVPPWRKKGARR